MGNRVAGKPVVEWVEIGLARLALGDCLEIVPTLGSVDHVICDPPYEEIMHEAKKGGGRSLRTDGGRELQSLGFASIDEIRADVVRICGEASKGWFIAFCTPEGVGRWADEINASPMRYKRACVWIKPDSTPQLNGQGPAQGAENFVTAWAGEGFSRWNSGGKRGVYTHLVNNPERSGEHPTEKPRRLMSEIIADFTSAGETICDPFAGSGTTGVAAVMASRRFIGIEKDSTYFALMCRRIEDAQRQFKLFDEAAA